MLTGRPTNLFIYSFVYYFAPKVLSSVGLKYYFKWLDIRLLDGQKSKTKYLFIYSFAGCLDRLTVLGRR